MAQILKPDFEIDDKEPKSTLVSKNITVNGRRTSVRLEPAMWSALRDISKRENCSIHELCSLIALRKKEKTSLTAAIRVFLMLYFRAACTEEGHANAGHGDFSKMVVRAKADKQVRILPERKSAIASNASQRIFNPSVVKTKICDAPQKTKAF